MALLSTQDAPRRGSPRLPDRAVNELSAPHPGRALAYPTTLLAVHLLLLPDPTETR